MMPPELQTNEGVLRSAEPTRSASSFAASRATAKNSATNA